MDDFNYGASTIDERMLAIRVSMYLGSALGIFVVIAFAVILVLITHMIDSQISDCSDLLLKLDKVQIHSSLLALKSNLRADENKYKRNSDKTKGDHLSTEIHQPKSREKNIEDLGNQRPPINSKSKLLSNVAENTVRQPASKKAPLKTKKQRVNLSLPRC